MVVIALFALGRETLIDHIFESFALVFACSDEVAHRCKQRHKHGAPEPEEQKHQQIVREMKATLILFLIVAVWHIGTAFALNGIDFLIIGMPLWFFVSTIGAFVISVAGVIVLLKKVFVNFDLGEEVPEEKTRQTRENLHGSGSH